MVLPVTGSPHRITVVNSTPPPRSALRPGLPALRFLCWLAPCGLLLVFALLPAISGPLAAATAEPSDHLVAGCSERAIPSMGWARGGAWAPDGSLWLLDVLDRGFIRFVPDTGEYHRVRSSEGGWNHPASIKQRGGELLVYDHGRVAQVMDGPTGEIRRLDGSLATAGLAVEDRGLDGLEATLGAGAVLKNMYDWHPVGNGVLAFGDIKLGGKAGWASAFVYFDPAGAAQIFETVPIDADVFNQYARNVSYIAGVGDVGYVLFLNENPIIGRLEPGAQGIRYLPAFPEDFRNRPLLETNQKWAGSGQGARQATYFYRVLEGARMAAGLYSHNGGLYLLAKEAMAADGSTAWWMIRLDPADGAEMSRVRLPTAAAHLDVIFGEEHVALVQKGPVQGMGDLHAPYMETRSVVLLPTAWVETDTGWLPPGGSHCLPLNS